MPTAASFSSISHLRISGSALKPISTTKLTGAAAVFMAVCAMAAWFGTTAAVETAAPWYSIVPPLLAIVLAFLTHHVILSLGIAVLVAGLLATVPASPADASAWGAGTTAAAVFIRDTVTSTSNQRVLCFIPPIFTMVEIIIAAGGFLGIVRWLLRRVRGKTSAQLATAGMGLVCFIDDYANAIVVGSMMQPITDRFRISRAKLAFLVDATSAPVSGLAVVSTWIAYEVGLFSELSEQLDLGKSGYAMFFDALSFRFYCLLMLGFVFVHVLLRRDFGPMRAVESQAQASDATDTQANARLDAAGPALNALLPLGALLGFHMTGLWFDGGGPARLAEGGSVLTWTYWRDVISAAQHSHEFLFGAALFGILVAVLCGLLTRALRPSALPGCAYRGVRRALLPSVTLILAWSLKNACETLGTGDFLTALLAGRIPPHLFPPLLFVVASITSFATGTSWGTMAILLPTAIPIAFALDGNTYGMTTVISLGAVLDGAIFGDHCSPISDTTIISSTATGCDLLEHVRTQLPYSLLVAAAALTCAYTPSAFGLGSAWGLGLALAVVVIALLLVGRGSGSQGISPPSARTPAAPFQGRRRRGGT
jgi:Na+/H+ antiporter NhaC